MDKAMLKTWVEKSIFILVSVPCNTALINEPAEPLNPSIQSVVIL